MLPMNTQTPEGVAVRPDGHLEVVDVFDTIQGEGPFVGVPAVFVRLAGCNLQCPLCDTDYTSDRRWIDPRELVAQIHACGPVCRKLVVITGGEPFRQNLRVLIIKLTVHGYHVQIETNGTLGLGHQGKSPWWLHTQRVAIVVSPKAPKVHPDIEQGANAYKYVLSAGAVDPEDGLPTSVLGNRLRVARPPAGFDSFQVYVQPADEGDPDANARNLEAAMASCRAHGYRLSVQLHKQLGLP
jgi:organic radical activating enzyme